MTRRSYTSAVDTGQAAPLAMPEFDLDDVTFVCEGRPSVLDLSEFARLAVEGVDTGSPEGVAILAQVFLTMLGPQTYQRFRAHCRKHATPDEKLLAIIGGMIEDASDLPTSRPSSSLDGPPTTGRTAMVVSLSRATVRHPSEEEPTGGEGFVAYG